MGVVREFILISSGKKKSDGTLLAIGLKLGIVSYE